MGLFCPLTTGPLGLSKGGVNAKKSGQSGCPWGVAPESGYLQPTSISSTSMASHELAVTGMIPSTTEQHLKGPLGPRKEVHPAVGSECDRGEPGAPPSCLMSLIGGVGNQDPATWH